MRKPILAVLAGMMLVLATLACSITIPYGGGSSMIRGSGSMVSEERSVSGVHGVELAMNGTLNIRLGDSEALTIEAEDNLLQYIETSVRGGTLLIKTRSGTNVKSTRSINFVLTVSDLNSVSVSSSGDIIASALEDDRCDIEISSSGSISLESVDCTTLSTRISSSGQVSIAGGSAERQEIRISSSGDYLAPQVVSSDADITISSSGSATVNVLENITGSISSSGDIYYFGDPQVNVRTSSSGTVQRMGY